MKARLIVNPTAGTDAAVQHLTQINERIRLRVGLLDIVITTGEGDAARAAEDAVRSGYDHVFVGGGDGTLNEVLNGIGAVSGGFAAVVLGIVPLGTGNDFASAMGYPADIAAAADTLFDAPAAWVDVGQLNDRYFINVSAGGFIAEVSDAVSPQLKNLAGRLAYVIGGATVVLEHEPVGVRVESPAHSVSMAINMFAVCNSRLIGGGRLIAPEARVDDGLLDVYLVEAMSKVEFVALLTRLSDGAHTSDDRVTYFRAAELDLHFDRTVKVNTDGQVLETDFCRYRVLPSALRVLRP
jgi:diacylglycerol kinase (ATP)